MKQFASLVLVGCLVAAGCGAGPSGPSTASGNTKPGAAPAGDVMVEAVFHHPVATDNLILVARTRHLHHVR